MLVNAANETTRSPFAREPNQGLAMRRKIMFRKLALGLFAAASLGAAALAPTSASAFYGGPHWHPGFGFHRFWAPRVVVGGPVYYGGYSCVVRRWVMTPWGPRPRLINRCY